MQTITVHAFGKTREVNITGELPFGHFQIDANIAYRFPTGTKVHPANIVINRDDKWIPAPYATINNSNNNRPVAWMDDPKISETSKGKWSYIS